MKPTIGVIGDQDATKETLSIAKQVGWEIAKAGFILVCGGRRGVMEAACQGAKEAGGLTVGILPSSDKKEANPYVDIVIPTGLGYARNTLVVLASDGVVGVGGRSGTLTEIAYAWMHNRPIVAITTAGGWGAKMAGKSVDDRREDVVLGFDDARSAIHHLTRQLGKQHR
ncbi:MAG: TIGR00725 family protein [Methanobacteriota archaeon]|nr:MAG: TIGR00725 family protein [Euryarchaeota archaeon]